MAKQPIKHFSIKEFREKGFLQEANRQFFHPLGLALQINVDEETGEETLGGIWDCRDDPEGVMFTDNSLQPPAAVEKAKNVLIEAMKHAPARMKLFDSTIQPIKTYHHH
jgi:hypothetical protein